MNKKTRNLLFDIIKYVVTALLGYFSSLFV